MEDRVRVLIVEDNEADVRLCREALAEDTARAFDVTVTASLSNARAALGQNDFDVILLDLSLPDSQGLETVSALFGTAGDIPIIVTTGINDDQLGIRAVTLGASDYLPKVEISGPILCRAVNYAIERQHLQGELRQARERERELREIEGLVRLSAAPPTSATARALGQRPLKEMAPEVRRKIAREYETVFTAALKLDKTGAGDPHGETLREIAWQLGFLHAKAHDVIELHTDTTVKLMEGATAEHRQHIIDAGRAMVLELMGFVLEYYRNLTRGGSGDAPPPRDDA